MGFSREKLNATILFIGSNSNVVGLGLTKMYKLVYFADVAHLRNYGSSITGSEYIKYQHGPVPSRGEKCVKQLRRDAVLEGKKVSDSGYEMMALRSLGTPDLTALTNDELETLQGVCEKLGAETATSLSTLSHQEPAWLTATMLDKLSDELMFYGAAEDPDGL